MRQCCVVSADARPACDCDRRNPTSLRAVMENPFAMAAWGLIVAVLLAIGSLPFFVGLAVVLPVLGHATWHLYRKVVEPDPNPPQEQPRPPNRTSLCGRFPGLPLPAVESRALVDVSTIRKSMSVFRQEHAQTKKIERDEVSKRSHLAPGMPACRATTRLTIKVAPRSSARPGRSLPPSSAGRCCASAG